MNGARLDYLPHQSGHSVAPAPRSSEVHRAQAQAVAFLAEDLVGWERSLVAFLVEKERRSGSTCLVTGKG